MDTLAPSRTFQLPATAPTPRGAAFAKALALVGLHGNTHAAERIAEASLGAEHGATRILKAAVAAGTTTDAQWAAPLSSDSGAREVFTAIRERSIIGRLSGARRVPPNLSVVLQTEDATASWVKQNAAKPVTKLGYTAGPQLPIRKVVAQILATRELLRLSRPDAEDLFRESLLSAVTKAQDEAFITPGNAGVADEKPASILNGVTPIASAGSADADVSALTGAFTGDLSASFYVAHPSTAAAMSGVSRPNVGAKGGEISGIGVITSRHCPADILALIDPTGLLYFEEGAGMDISENALVQMDSAPTSPPTADTVVTSAWEINLVAMKVELFTNWVVGRPGSVAYVNAIAW